MENPTDSSLMRLVQTGDSAQLGVLFERYHVALFRYLLQLSRNRALSEDLVQEVFFRVLKYAASYDPSLAFPVWLYRMARNAYFDSLRSQRSVVAADEATEIRSSEPAPEELLTRKQDASFLQEALQMLPEDKREVLVLSRFHNLRYKEIALILHCEVGTVKVRVYRALKELREKFCQLRGERLYDV
ncbi:MAG: sigma-70 family RNA polymerase sigma factor [Acidobacteriaceae bacterium]|nr:sigma-70 family RNA polymerase sigma factor [Acidobacteriaceae bacterium]